MAPFGVDLGDIEDAIKEYGPGAALGGGIGFLTGGPPGAAIGAGGAIAGQLAAKEAVKALPEDSPDWLKTGVEFGVYGATGAVGEGVLAQRGLTAALRAVLEDGGADAAKKGLAQAGLDAGTHLNFGSILRSGAESGVGAVGGKFVAEQLGIPPLLGEIAGSIAGPVAVTHFTAARANNAERMLAETSADANVNSRAMSTTKMPMGSTQDDLNGLDSDIAGMQRRLSLYSTQQSDDYIKAQTGGFGRADVVRLARGQMPENVRDVMTPELIAAQRRLPKMASQWDNAKAALADAQAKLPGTEADGALVAQKDHFLWKSADGTEKLVPDADAQAYLTAQKKFQSIDTQMKNHLGTDAVPEDSAAQLLALRNKHVPNWQELAGGDNLPEPAVAQQWLKDIHQGDIDLAIKNTGASSSTQQQIQRHQDLRDFLAEHQGEFGLINPKERAQAARDFAAWKQQDSMLQQYPGGLTRPTEHAEDFGNYLKYANLVSSAEKTNATKVAKFQDILANPRGSYVVQDANGAVAPKKFLGVTAPGMDDKAVAQALATGKTDGLMARVRGTQVAAPEELVPLDSLKLRYTDEQLKVRSLESGSAGRALWENLPPDQQDAFKAQINDIQRPEIAQDQVHYSTEAQRQAAIKMGKPDGAVIENDRNAAWTDFNSRFTPVENTIEAKNFTPEYKARLESGQTLLWNRAPRPGANAEEKAAFWDARKMLTTAVQERQTAGYAVDDPQELSLLRGIRSGDYMPDLMTPIRMMAAMSHDPIYELGQAQPMKGWLGQMVDKYLVGQKVLAPLWRGLLQSHLNASEANATFVGATYGPTIQQAQKRASEMLNEAEGGASLLKAVGTLVKTRSFSQAFEEVHPISRQSALEGLLAREFKPEGLDPGLAKARNALTPEQQALADGHFTSMWTNFVENPKAFPGIANDEVLTQLAAKTKMLDEHVNAGQTLLASRPQSNVQKLMMMVAPDMRKYVNQDALEGAGGNTYNLAKSVFNISNGLGKDGKFFAKPFSEMLTHGQEADLSGAMATYNTMAMHELFGRIREMAPGLDRADLSFSDGAWRIKNLEKAPKEMWGDINGINDILSGNHRWGGLQKWSQQIAMGNLAADLSILGIQGWKVAAHSLLSGNPMGAVKTLAVGMTHIMSDAGYYSWMKNNAEELTYLSSLGLTGGLKQFIAGPDIQKLPLENIPGLGRAFTGIREGTDLQFNRALYYWKVQGVRQQLDFAKTMQNIPREMADRFVSSSPSAQAVVNDLGGLDSYIYGAKEATAQAVVRQINRSLGGVNMNAEGIGATRQAIEQITMVVPGFFRAQAGQWAAAVTKPQTLEGQLAISMLAKEYMFAGSVATGMARLMGTEHKVNWDDPSKATWLGVPLPDGTTMTLTPTMAIPRLAARVVKEAITAPQDGRVPNPAVALDQFVRGRMSPLVSPILEAFEGHDFYGNKYTSNIDKWGSTLSHVALPILADTMINDIKEGIRQGQATGSVNVNSMALDSVTQLMGKNAIPASPGTKLNDLANQAYGTDWNLLTDAEKSTMQQNNPAIKGLQVEYDFVSNRRATTEQSHVDMAYKDYQANHDQVWTQPTSINGTTSTQQQDDQLLKAGQMTGDDWRSRYHVRQQASAQWYDALRQRLSAEGYDPDKVRQDHMDKLQEARGHDPNDQAWLVQDARVRYLGQKPDTVPQEITTPNGPVTIQVTDWQAFRDKQQAVLAQYPEPVRVLAQESALADSDPGIAAYKSASEQQQQIESLPRYKGLSVDQGNKVDTVLSVMSKMADSIKGQMGLPPGTAVPGLTEAIRAKAISSLQTAGVLKTSEDMQLATMAVAMAENRKLADSLRNPAQVLAVLQSPQAVVYYPYLRYRVPKDLWSRLPAQIFQSPLAAAELQAQE